MKTILWLDDVRNPADYENLLFHEINESDGYNLTWVKSYDMFIEYIEEFGLPYFIFFDHDLGKPTSKYFRDIGYSKKKARSLAKIEKTGYDCAKWLCKYCSERGLELPLWRVHSYNPIGKANIESELKLYERLYKLSE